MIRLFTYGTLQSKERLEALVGSRATGPKEAVLPGYRKVETSLGYPAVFADEDSSVQGSVWEFSDVDFKYLDRYEGVNHDPPYYCRTTATVELDGEGVDAFVYVGNPEFFALDSTEVKGSELSPATLAAHGGLSETASATRAPGTPPPLVHPITQASVYAFDSLEQLDEVWTGARPGYIYSRMSNPTVDELEDTMAELEGAEQALAAGAGTAAILSCLLAAAPSGSHIVATREAYGGTHGLLTADFPNRFGVEVDMVDMEDLEAVQAAIKRETTVLYVESLTNPLIRLAPLVELIELAHQFDLTVIVDNTFATPHLLRPLALGADIAVHSATKFINGHGDATLGVAAGSGETIETARKLVTRYGFNPDPFATWLVHRGIRTLAVRMERASENALQLGELLMEHPSVESVNYPGLPESPYYERAAELMPAGAGAMLSFTLEGGLEAASRFVRALQLVRFAPSLGDVTTTISHPGLTSHRELAPAERQAVGITDGLIRVSVGIEAPADILADFESALKQV